VVGDLEPSAALSSTWLAHEYAVGLVESYAKQRFTDALTRGSLTRGSLRRAALVACAQAAYVRSGRSISRRLCRLCRPQHGRSANLGTAIYTPGVGASLFDAPLGRRDAESQPNG
jgi:hypothetical protein